MAYKDGPTVLVGFLGSAVLFDGGSVFCTLDIIVDPRNTTYAAIDSVMVPI